MCGEVHTIQGRDDNIYMYMYYNNYMLCDLHIYMQFAYTLKMGSQYICMSHAIYMYMYVLLMYIHVYTCIIPALSAY